MHVFGRWEEERTRAYTGMRGDSALHHVQTPHIQYVKLKMQYTIKVTEAVCKEKANEYIREKGSETFAMLTEKREEKCFKA